MDKAIIVDHLFKDSIFKDISFTLQSGEFVGLLGPKGSGKTTLIKILSGLKSLDSGFISVMGFNPLDRKEDYLKQISVIFSGKNELSEDLLAIQSIELNKIIYKISDRDYRKKLNELVDLLRVSKFLNINAKDLNDEQKIKIELVLSLIYNPKIIFIDEPFFRFDLKTQHFLFDFLYEYFKRNETTILLSSESVNELIGLVRRVIVIDEQKLLFDGPLEKIIDKNVNYE